MLARGSYTQVWSPVQGLHSRPDLITPSGVEREINNTGGLTFVCGRKKLLCTPPNCYTRCPRCTLLHCQLHLPAKLTTLLLPLCGATAPLESISNSGRYIPLRCCATVPSSCSIDITSALLRGRPDRQSLT